MSGADRPEQTVDDGVVADAQPPCVALVPMVQSAPWSRVNSRPAQPDSIFVTHLLATAEQLPQTRSRRRATAADAQTAYGPHQAQGAGIRTRQII